MSKAQAKRFLEKEAQSLYDTYRRSPIKMTSIAEESTAVNIKLIMERCHKLGSLEFRSAMLQEEQEHELSPKIEQERQAQKLLQAQPVLRRVYPYLETFVSSGILDGSSEVYLPVFKSLCNTSAATHLDVSQFSSDLLVIADFDCTIQITGVLYLSDWYQRPLQ